MLAQWVFSRLMKNIFLKKNCYQQNLVSKYEVIFFLYVGPLISVTIIFTQVYFTMEQFKPHTERIWITDNYEVQAPRTCLEFIWIRILGIWILTLPFCSYFLIFFHNISLKYTQDLNITTTTMYIPVLAELQRLSGCLLISFSKNLGCTVGIRIPDVSGTRMVYLDPVFKWFGFRMVEKQDGCQSICLDRFIWKINVFSCIQNGLG